MLLVLPLRCLARSSPSRPAMADWLRLARRARRPSAAHSPCQVRVPALVHLTAGAMTFPRARAHTLEAQTYRFRFGWQSSGTHFPTTSTSMLDGRSDPMYSYDLVLVDLEQPMVKMTVACSADAAESMFNGMTPEEVRQLSERERGNMVEQWCDVPVLSGLLLSLNPENDTVRVHPYNRCASSPCRSCPRRGR